MSGMIGHLRCGESNSHQASVLQPVYARVASGMRIAATGAMHAACYICRTLCGTCHVSFVVWPWCAVLKRINSVSVGLCWLACHVFALQCANCPNCSSAEQSAATGTLCVGQNASEVSSAASRAKSASAFHATGVCWITYRFFRRLWRLGSCYFHD